MTYIETVRNNFIILNHIDNANQNRLSYMDVKSVYDAAYEQKAKARASLQGYQSLMRQAERLEAAYRAQIEADAAARYQPLAKAA